MAVYNDHMSRMPIQWKKVTLGVFMGIGGIGLIWLSWLAVVFLFAESYFTPDPYIDTITAKEFSWEQWENIKPGMTQQEVRMLLGQPIRQGHGGYGGFFGIKSGQNFTEGSCDEYSEDGAFRWWDFAWISINVCYDDLGNVVGKNELIMYN